jgi:flagellar basal-body rod protein FlgB
MEIGKVIGNRLVGKTVGLLSQAMDYRSANHGVITGNLANVDTPGYRPQELTFDQELRRAVDGEGIFMKKTDERHMPRPTDIYEGKATHQLVANDQEIGDSNQLNIDKEMANMAQNNILYEATAKLLTKKLDGLRMVIEGRR